MFAYIKGTLIHVSPMAAIIESCGIGYKIFIPASAFAQMPHQNEAIIMHLSFVVREQAQTLYGFFSANERDFFEALLGVTGIGPKLALALIGHMPLHDLQKAIADEDTASICRVPGIGKKGAERLIIEMRDKIAAFGHVDISISTPNNPQKQKISDAMNALINLGYNQMTAQKAIQKSLKDSSEEIELGELISCALKHV